MKKIISVILFVLLGGWLNISAQTITNLYLVGSATSCGWDTGNPEPMVKISDEIFEWTGSLVNGQFKFLLEKKHFNCLAAESEDVNVTANENEYNLVYEPDYTSGQGMDYKFVITVPDVYTIRIHTATLKMTIVKAADLMPDVWLVGSAIPDGVVKLEKQERWAPGQLRYEGKLLKGSFRVATNADVTANDVEFYLPVLEDMDACGTTALLKTADADGAGWNVIVEDDYYKLIFNFLSLTYKGEMCSNHSPVYIVGGATEAGWEAGQAIPLARTIENPVVFMFEGMLRINDTGVERDMFKLVLQKWWNPYSYHPQTENEIITTSSGYTSDTGTDLKWTISPEQQGYYRIKLDVLHETIEAEYLGATKPTSDNNVSADNFFRVCAVNGSIMIELNNQDEENEVSYLYDSAGRLIEVTSVNQPSFTIGTNLRRGMYFIILKTGKKTYKEKIIM